MKLKKIKPSILLGFIVLFSLVVLVIQSIPVSFIQVIREKVNKYPYQISYWLAETDPTYVVENVDYLNTASLLRALQKALATGCPNVIIIQKWFPALEFLSKADRDLLAFLQKKCAKTQYLMHTGVVYSHVLPSLFDLNIREQANMHAGSLFTFHNMGMITHAHLWYTKLCFEDRQLALASVFLQAATFLKTLQRSSLSEAQSKLQTLSSSLSQQVKGDCTNFAPLPSFAGHSQLRRIVFIKPTRGLDQVTDMNKVKVLIIAALIEGRQLIGMHRTAVGPLHDSVTTLSVIDTLLNGRSLELPWPYVVSIACLWYLILLLTPREWINGMMAGVIFFVLPLSMSLFEYGLWLEYGVAVFLTTIMMDINEKV